ncbi:response regulator transcription factor [Halomonas piscis]|uniref:response regulator transcription factor n=1 Tax=Halomonas piscis TaxID=3031727 RepID=UPI00289EC41A|nr:LuxR C-terminal-related transcriptional regulator [Halomonas piscis]
MHITQGQFKAQINDQRGGTGFTRGEATDMLLLAAGHTLKEIGRATGRSPETVKASLGRAKHKLGVYRAAGAIAEALRRGWIAPLILVLMVADLSGTAMRVRQPTRPTSRVSASRQIGRRNAGSQYA